MIVVGPSNGEHVSHQLSRDGRHDSGRGVYGCVGGGGGGGGGGGMRMSQ